MVRGFRVGALALLLALGLGTGASAQYDGQFQRRLSAPAAPFVDVLSPHGDWLNVDPFGTVWRPSPQVVGSEFIPYATDGRWAYAPVGWVFVSNWSWGWATFHYGYWLFDANLGWIWVPGTQWAPAWVDWRFGGGLVGWAPALPPFGYGWSGSGWYAGWPGRWCFAHVEHFAGTDVGRHLVDRHQSPHAHEVTQPVPRRPGAGGTAWAVGPSPFTVVGGSPGRIPTVDVQPPPEGRIEPVADGRLVERDPAELEGPVSKPTGWVTQRPAVDEDERAEPAAPQPAPGTVSGAPRATPWTSTGRPPRSAEPPPEAEPPPSAPDSDTGSPSAGLAPINRPPPPAARAEPEPQPVAPAPRDEPSVPVSHPAPAARIDEAPQAQPAPPPAPPAPAPAPAPAQETPAASDAPGAGPHMKPVGRPPAH